MRLAALFRDMPIRRKLTLIAVLSAGVALLFAALISMVQQWFMFRAELVKTTTSQAIIVAANSTSALLFNDPKSANQTLEALRPFDSIEFAMMHDKQGKLFAMFVPAGMQPPPPHRPPQEERHIFSATHLDVFKPIVFEGERVGTIHVRSGLAQVYRQMAWGAAVVAAAALGALGLALLLIAYMHPAITAPMGKLVGVMDRISREKNYGLRVEAYGRDEVGILGRAFNDMLERIQERDAELEQHRERLEGEVAQRTARLTEAQRIAHLGNWEWDVANNRLDWSDEIYRIFGLTPQQFEANYEAFLNAVHPEDRQSVDASVHETLEQGYPLSIDHRILLPDGSLRYVHGQAEVSRNGEGQAVRMLGTVQDITERKLAEEAFQQSEEKYRSLVCNIPDVVWTTGQDGKTTFISDNVERTYGYTPEEIYADPDLWFGSIHPDDVDRVSKAFSDLFAANRQFGVEYRIQRKDGEWIWLYDRSFATYEKAGVNYADGMFTNITERKLAEEQIRQLNAELEEKVQERTKQLLEAQEDLVRKEKLAVLGQVAGSVGHELRNPLGVMNNAVFFLQTVLSDADGTVKEYLGMIRDEIAGADRIVSDLLDSVRTKPPHPEAVGLGELIGQTLRKLTVPASVAVRLDIPVTLPLLQVDPLQVQQVLRNLISNGIDAMAEGGTLEIRGARAAEGKTVAVSVRDSGCGMTPEQMARLFQPLFTSKARGIGLGLVVVKNLTEANGGTVAVESRPGKGTTFTVTLPAGGG